MTTVDLSNKANRMARDFSPGYSSWRSGARAYAKRNGACMAVRQDGSAVLFYRDGGRVRQKAFRSVRIVRRDWS